MVIGDGPSAAGPATGTPDISNLGATLRRGVAISTGSLVFVQVVALAQVIFLARLLTPAEVGVYAAGTLVSVLLLTFAESGLSAALVQRKRDVDDAATTVFWATVGFGVLTSLVALAAAPLIAVVFDSRTAGLVAAASAAGLLLQALTTVPDALMQRRFNFMRRLVVDPSVAVSHAAVAIPLGVAGFGVWSLVIAAYTSYVVAIVLTWSLVRWRPSSGRFSLRMLGELIRFSLPLIIGSIGVQVREGFETVLVARLLNTAALGQFRYSRRLSQVPAQAFMQVAGYVLFPAFSRIANDAARLKRAFLRALGVVSLASIPVAGLLVAIAEPLVVVVLGQQWRPAGAALVAMAGFVPGVALSAVGLEVIKGCGRSHLVNRLTALSLVGGVAMLVALSPFGLFGLGLAISAEGLVVGAATLGLAARVAGVGLAEVAARLAPPVLAAVVATAAILPLEHLVLRSDEHGAGVGLALLVADAVAFAAVYLVVLWLVAPAGIRNLVQAAGSWRARRAARAEVQS